MNNRQINKHRKRAKDEIWIDVSEHPTEQPSLSPWRRLRVRAERRQAVQLLHDLRKTLLVRFPKAS